MARTSLAELSRNDHCRHSRSLFFRQLFRWVPLVRRRQGHAVERQLHVLARTETGTSTTRRKIRNRKTENTATRARMDSHVAKGASRQRQSAHQLVRRSSATGNRETPRRSRDSHPRWTTTRQRRDRSRTRQERVWRELAG